MGLVKTGQLVIALNRHHSQNRFLEIRLSFVIWLVFALEFQLGVDIVSTILSSTFESLGKLGVVALIRTFLNYFLTQEVASQDRRQEK